MEERSPRLHLLEPAGSRGGAAPLAWLGRFTGTPRGPARGAGLSLAGLSDGSPGQSASRSVPAPPPRCHGSRPPGPRRPARRLRPVSVPPRAEQPGLAWRLLRRAEARLGDVGRRRAGELREVESYVGHVRNLTEEWDNVIMEYEKENEHLRDELMQLQQEAQLKEVKEMLEQEGLSEIAHSNASEQIAYLLVERTTLLEKLEITDQKLNSHSYVDRLCAAQLQVHPALAAQTV
ncbi:uncharacterized protein V3H86_011696 [Mergus octosetaceus]